MYPRRGMYSEMVWGKNGVIGVAFGADATTEHECGVKPIWQAFGLRETRTEGLIIRKEVPVYGLERRTNTLVPPTFQWFKHQEEGEGFAFGSHLDAPTNTEVHFYRHRDHDPDPIAAAWSDERFVIVAREAKHIRGLREIFDAFNAKQGAFLRPNRLFTEGGLMMGIATRIPYDVAAEWTAADKQREEELAFMRESGIEAILSKAKKNYFALRPQKNADGTFDFWLNPMEQHNNNLGRYSLEDLKLWAENKGPIPKKKGA
jgi:hypothetical protein